MGGGRIPPVVFSSIPKTACASAMKLGDFFVTIYWAFCAKSFTSYLVQRRLQGHFLRMYFSLNVGVFRHFPSISALLRLAIATDYIHRHLYAFTTMWRHLVMLNVSIGGSREEKRKALPEMNKPPFSAYMHPRLLPSSGLFTNKTLQTILIKSISVLNLLNFLWRLH